MKHIFNDPIMYFIFFILVFIFIPSAYYWKIELFKSLIGTALAVLGLYIAIVAYNKVYSLGDEWLIYNIADRSIAWETRLDKLQGQGRISPVFINQGGDAIAYENLVKKYIASRKDEELREHIAQQLNKIYDNIESTDSTQFFQYASVNLDENFDLNKDFNWLELNGTRYQTNELFLPKSIVGQLNHKIFWMTRAQCARYLREEKTFKEFTGDKLKREKLLADFDPENMFKELVFVIENDYSLVVRKEALNTYLYWACENNECKLPLINDGVYYFNKISKHWFDKKSEILKKFQARIGLSNSSRQGK